MHFKKNIICFNGSLLKVIYKNLFIGRTFIRFNDRLFIINELLWNFKLDSSNYFLKKKKSCNFINFMFKKKEPGGYNLQMEFTIRIYKRRCRWRKCYKQHKLNKQLGFGIRRPILRSIKPIIQQIYTIIKRI